MYTRQYEVEGSEAGIEFYDSLFGSYPRFLDEALIEFDMAT